MMPTSTFPRHTATSSAGSRDGKRYGVWDRHERRVVAWYATFKGAQAEAKRRNATKA